MAAQPWRWDGQRWVSLDDRFWWDGSVWQPLQQVCEPTSPRLRHRLAVGSQVHGGDARMYRVRGASIKRGRFWSRPRLSYYAEGSDGAFYWLLEDAIRLFAEGLWFRAEPEPAAGPGSDGRPGDCPASAWHTGSEGQILADSAPDGTCGDSGGPPYDAGSPDSGGWSDAGGSSDMGGSSDGGAGSGGD